MSERTRIGFYSRQIMHIRMAGYPGRKFSVGIQDRLVKISFFRQHRVLGETLMAGGKKKPVAVFVPGILRIRIHFIEIQSGDDINRGKRSSDMAMSACTNHPENILSAARRLKPKLCCYSLVCHTIHPAF